MSAQGEQEAWYAVYTKHQHEKSATELLGAKGFEVLLPLYRAVHRWKDRKQVVELPLFSCYLFVRTKLNRRLDILKTPGVFWLVGSLGEATPIPESEIDAVRKILQGDARIRPHPFLRCGDRVRVRSGPLTGLEGILVREKSEYRVVLSLELLRKAVAVEVDLGVLERLPTGHEGTSFSENEARRTASTAT